MQPALHIVHRGGASGSSTEPLFSFAHAIRSNCDGCAFNLRLTDGQLMVDDTGGEEPSQMTGNRGPSLQLDEVIEFVRSRSDTTLLVVSPTSALDQAVDRPWLELIELLVQRLQDHNFMGRSVLTSPDWGSLIYAKQLAPEILTWFATMPSAWLDEKPPPADTRAPDAGCRVRLRAQASAGDAPWYAGFDPSGFDNNVPAAIRAAGGEGWYVHHSAFDQHRAVKAHHEGILSIVWRAGHADPIAYHRLLAHGSDAICTDFAEVKPAAMTMNIRPIVEKAAAAYTEQAWERAIEGYGFIVQRFPNNAPIDTFVKLAVAQRRSKAYAAANRTLDAGETVYPDHPRLISERATLLMVTEDWEGALAVWKRRSSGRQMSALDYNRYARCCEVMEQWDLHRVMVNEGRGRHPSDSSLRTREAYTAAHHEIRQNRFSSGLKFLEEARRGRRECVWPFATLFYRRQAELESELSNVESSELKFDLLESAHTERQALPGPSQLAGLPNALVFQRESGNSCELVRALSTFVDVMKQHDVDIRVLRSRRQASCTDQLAKLSSQAAVDGLVLPGSYYRDVSRYLLRRGYFKPYWRFRKRYVESLQQARIVGGQELKVRKLISQVAVANETRDHQYFRSLDAMFHSVDARGAVEIDELLFSLSRQYHQSPDAPASEEGWLGADATFANTVRGKSIAIVGPVPGALDVGDEIEDFDLVIRFNHRKSVTYEHSKFGSKTNLSWYLHGDIPSIGGADYLEAMNALDFVVVDEWCWARREWINQVKAPIRGRLESWKDPVTPFLIGNPNAVQRALLDLLRFDVGRVKIFNSNLFLSTQYAGGYRKPQKDLCSLLTLHDPVSNFAYLKALAIQGTVEFDSVLDGILRMSHEEYVDALDERYGRRFESA